MFPKHFVRMALAALLAFPALSGPSPAEDAPLMEQFALAKDRAAMLAKLIPGTEDYYLYHALHAQNSGRFEESRKLIEQWVAQHGRTETATRMLYRQVLLDYPQRPDDSRDFLVRELGVQLYHELPATARQRQLPSKFDSSLLDPAKLVRESIQQHGNLSQIQATGLLALDGATLSLEQLRELLNRYPVVTEHRLVSWIVRELSDKESKGFGSLAVHRFLTLAQLNELQKKRPELLNSQNFVFAKLERLRPNADVDLQANPEAWNAYLEVIEEFSRPLPPAFRALRASILYQRLKALRAQGKYDRALFIEYLKLPRSVPYIQPVLLEKAVGQVANLNEDFSSQAFLPPIVQDEPLVRDYLEQFLKDASNTDAFASYFQAEYLKRVFIETKIIYGVGDSKTWFNQLPADAQRELRERIELNWGAKNPRFLDLDGPARIEVDVKNVPRLTVRVFRINLPAYYRQTQQPINTDIDLDGLVAATQWEVTYDQAAWLRHRETIELKGVQGRGVWIVDVVGGGRRSRGLIARGDLRVIEEKTSVGHRFLVLDEKNQPVPNSLLALAGQDFQANEKGQIFVPYSEQASEQQAILVAGEFAKPVSFTHATEEYALRGGFYVHREGLQAGQKAALLIRARLLIGDRPISITALQSPVVTVTATDLDGSEMTQRFESLELLEDRETEIEIRTPPRLKTLKFQLQGKVNVNSRDAEETLMLQEQFEFETIRTSATLHQAQLAKTDDGYRLEVVGHSGEPAVSQAVRVQVWHSAVQQPVEMTLAADASGHIQLGHLFGARRLQVSGPQLLSHQWPLHTDVTNWPQRLHIGVQERITLPIVNADATWNRKEEIARLRWQLLEIRYGSHHRDLTDQITESENQIEIAPLSPGSYQLSDVATGNVTRIEVAGGELVQNQWISASRTLESVKRPTAFVKSLSRDGDKVVLQLSGASKFTRVHLLMSRYVLPIAPGTLALPDISPSKLAYRKPTSGYVSNLRLDDEYRYILERQLAKKYPGNMLPQPTLQLHSWDLGESQSKDLAMMGGEAMPPAPSSPAAADPQAMSKEKREAESVAVPGDPLTVEYLKSTGDFLTNLIPDDKGTLVLDSDALGDSQMVTVWVVDPLAVQVRTLPLKATELTPEDLRLPGSLPSDKSFAQTRAVISVEADKPLEIGDVQSARAQVYATIGDLYQYYASQVHDERFARFAFLPTWSQLKDEGKLEKYNEFACHEFHLFLYFKDRPFFDRVVKPLLQQKKDPQFVDRWLLEEDLSRFAELWAYGQLNAAERALLAGRLEPRRAATLREMHDWLEMHPVNPQEADQRVMSALMGKGLAANDAVGLGLVELAEKSDMLKQQVESKSHFAFGGGMGGMGGGDENRGGAVAESRARKSASVEKLMRDQKRRGIGLSKDKNGADRAEDYTDHFFGTQMMASGQSTLFRQIARTKRWAESQYYRQTVEQVTPELVPVRTFWRDVAMSPSGQPSRSTDLLSPVSNFSEALLALAVIDLPLERPEIETKGENGRLVIHASRPAVVVTEQIREVKPRSSDAATLLIGQRFSSDNTRPLPGSAPSAVTEFVIGEVYRSQIVVSNPTAEVIDASVLVQIPEGSLPLEGTRPTDARRVRMEPFSTQQIQFAFYFPVPGEFRVYGAVASKESELLVAAPSKTLNVLPEPSEPDAKSWPYLVQHGTPDQVAEFLRSKANLYQIDLVAIAPRLGDRAMFDKVTEVLDELRRYEPTLWGYALKHQVASRIHQYLEHRPEIVSMTGPVIQSELLATDPIEHELYEHIEFRPLEIPRKHPAGGRWQIPNEELQQQWDAFVSILAHQATPDDRERLSLTYYLLLQYRIEEAIEQFERINRAELKMPMAYDYLAAYLNFYRGRYSEAAQIAAQYQDVPVQLWKERFALIASQVKEHDAMIDGEPIELPQSDKDPTRLVSTAEMRRERDQAAAAALQPTFDLRIEGPQVFLKWQNVTEVEVNYYLLDVELLFTRNPFVQGGSSRASLVEPNESKRLKLPSKTGETSFKIPEHLAKQNVLVEIVAGNFRQSQVASGGDLAVQFASGYGHLQASLAGTSKPMIGAYVKVYVREKDGEVRYWKDGYTDLRGRFDYASLSGSDIADVARFSILILEPEHGAQIREIEPPR